MLLNAMAMEYVALLDNEYEEMYFKFVPSAAVEVFDTYFKESEERSRAFYLCWLPYKILLLALIVFPVACFAFVFYGAACK